jgi:hypothetical protein
MYGMRPALKAMTLTVGAVRRRRASLPGELISLVTSWYADGETEARLQLVGQFLPVLAPWLSRLRA